MNTIKFEDYTPNMGVLISLVDAEDYVEEKGSINLKLSQIIDNPSKYLDKNKRYFFYCLKGSRSRRAVSILGAYGYDVVKVIK